MSRGCTSCGLSWFECSCGRGPRISQGPVKVLKAETRNVVITEHVKPKCWRLHGEELRWITASSSTVEAVVVTRDYETAVEAQAACARHDSRFSKASGRSVVTRITWKPRTPIGRLVVKALV